jgi:hypothetical protein
VWIINWLNIINIPPESDIKGFSFCNFFCNSFF